MLGADPLEKSAKIVARRLRDSGFEAYFAGGSVRDLLRGARPKDYDIATNALPDEVARVFRRSRAVGAQFGVILVRESGFDFEVATYRADGAYVDGRRPVEVHYSTRKEDDIARRDFTINALLMDPESGEIVDLVGGRDDLREKRIRAVGDAAQRFAEDRLRMLRAVRFASVLEFEIEPTTLHGIREHADAITVVSRERIAMELTAMWTLRAASRSMKWLRSTSLLDSLFPFRTIPEAQLQARFDRFAAITGPLEEAERVALALTLMLEGADVRRDALLLEHRFSRDVIRKVERLFSESRVLLERVGTEADLCRPLIAADWSFLRAYLHVRASDDISSLWDAAKSAVQAEPYPELPLVTGSDLMSMGLKPGPRFKELLRAVEDAALTRRISDKPQALALVRELTSSPET